MKVEQSDNFPDITAKARGVLAKKEGLKCEDSVKTYNNFRYPN